MRRFLLIAFLALGYSFGGAMPANAQAVEVVQEAGRTRIRMAGLTAATSWATSTTSGWIDVRRYGAYDHVFSYTVADGSVSAISVSLQCSTDGLTVGSTIVTLTGTGTTTGTQGRGTGGCGYVRGAINSMTGTATITPMWVGFPTINAGGGGVTCSNDYAIVYYLSSGSACALFTSGRVPFAGANGLLGDSANLSFNSSTLTLATTSMVADSFGFTGQNLAQNKIAYGYNSINFTSYAAEMFDISGQTGAVKVPSGALYGWTPSSVLAGTSIDTGLSRISPGLVAVGSGSTANMLGSLRATGLQAITFGTSSGVTIISTGTPSCSGAGCALLAASQNSSGKVTTTTTGAGTDITITFSAAFNNAPACVASNETTAGVVRAISTTTTVHLIGTTVNGDSLAWWCGGH